MRTLLSALSVFVLLAVLAACAASDDDADDAADDDVAATEEPAVTPEQETTEPPESEETPAPDPSPTPEPEETPVPEDDDADDDDPNGEPMEHIIEMGDNFFDPATLEIAAGDTVTFVNEGGQAHTATLDPDEARDPDNIMMPDDAETWDSGNLDPGDEFSITLDVPGEYQYICRPHEALDMVGEIVVGEGDAAGGESADDDDDDDDDDADDDDDDVDDYL